MAEGTEVVAETAVCLRRRTPRAPTSDHGDLDEAVQVGQTAVDKVPPGSRYRARLLINLSCRLQDRFKRFGMLKDLQDALRAGRAAVDDTSREGHPDRAMALDQLGLVLSLRFGRRQHLPDLHESIAMHREALALTPRQDRSDRAAALNNLGTVLAERYDTTGAVADHDESTRWLREALDVAPDDYRHRGPILTNLSVRLRADFAGSGRKSDLDDAISCARKALQTASTDHPDRPDMLNSMANALRERFQSRGNTRDLEHAINVRQQALDLTPDDHPKQAQIMGNLSVDLRQRFRTIGAMMDLEEAIRLVTEALRNTPGDHPDRAVYLDTLSAGLRSRFRRTGLASDMDEAISLGREALAATPQDHQRRANFLNSLSALIHDRFRRTEIEALAELKAATSETVSAANVRPDRSSYYNNSLHKLYERFQRTKTEALIDLEDAIRLQREAVNATPKDQASRLIYLDNLGNHLHSRNERNQAAADRDEAIRVAQEAVNATPQGHPDSAARLNNLAGQIEARYRIFKSPSDGKLSLKLYDAALQVSSAPPRERIVAGLNAFECCLERNAWETARTMAEVIIKLSPRLVPRSTSRDDQQDLTKLLTPLSSRAASSVLLATGTPFEALSILEAGRGVIASMIIAARTDVSHLQAYAPQLYSEYTSLRQQVAMSFPTAFGQSFRRAHDPVSSTPIPVAVGEHVGNSAALEGINRVLQSTISRAISQRHRDVNRLEELEGEIRRLPGFERFLLAPTASEMIALSDRGPIVSFNVTELRSDAFIITPSGVVGLHLDSLRLNDLKVNVDALLGKGKLSKGKPSTKRSRQLELQRMLKWLWDVAVHPVLCQVGLLSPTPSRPLPHVWWITSGPMGLMPLHAAGDPTRTTMDCVVSTYTPSLRTLQYARQKDLQQSAESAPGLLVVAMTETAGMSPLETGEEVQVIRESFAPIKPTVLVNPAKSRVLEEMRSHHIIHFACHGNADAADPSSGGLFFGPTPDGDAEHLTIRELADTVHSKGQIAFLSACSTAENASDYLVDEGIHVASAFQLIGFPHVIGTQWESSDKAAVQVAGAFYKAVRDAVTEGGVRGGHDAVAYALHRAVGSLRAMKPNDVLSWVPFIHVGA